MARFRPVFTALKNRFVGDYAGTSVNVILNTLVGIGIFLTRVMHSRTIAIA